MNKSMMTFVAPLCGVVGLLALFPQGAAAQVIQRSTINPSFEVPQIGRPIGSACQGYIYASRVPGWRTTDIVLYQNSGPSPNFDSPNLCNGNPEPAPTAGTQVFEYFANNTSDNTTGLAMRAAQGSNFVELNAQTASRLYQNLCMVGGERVTYSFNHLGRRNGSVEDRARMQIGGNATLGSGTTVVTVGTTNDGDRRVVSTGLGTASATQGPSAGGTNRNWATYSGEFVVPTGINGLQQVAFEAVCSATGTGAGATCSSTNPNYGNFLDNIVISVNPVVELLSGAFTTIEGAAAAAPIQVRLVGVVPAGGISLSFTVTPGSAVLGTDYTINGSNAASFSYNVPAGDYGSGRVFDIPVSVVDDSVVESSETFLVSINPHSSYVLSSTSNCGAAATAEATYTINDNDARVVIVKDAVPNDARDFSFTSAGTGLGNFSLDDDADPTLPNSREFIVRPGRYTVTEALSEGWRLTELSCTQTQQSSTGNVGTRVATINVLAGESVTCTFTNTRQSAALTLRKTWVNAAVGDTATLSAIGSGVSATLASTAETTNETDISAAPTNISSGSVVTLSETLGGANQGRYVEGAWSCTGTSGLSGNTLTVGAADTNIVCSITNTRRSANLSVTKQNDTPTGGSVTSGATTVYNIVVTNNGPDAADGATFTDMPATGLNSCRVLSCTSTPSGSTCPANNAPVPATGLTHTITSFASGASLNILVQCTVN